MSLHLIIGDKLHSSWSLRGALALDLAGVPYTEAQGAAVMQQEEITIRIELGRGDCSETIWTTDLSHEYVKINAEYRT